MAPAGGSNDETDSKYSNFFSYSWKREKSSIFFSVSAMWPLTPRDAGEVGLTCYCAGHCPPSPHTGEAPEEGTCVASVGARCFAAVREVYNETLDAFAPHWTYGCMPADHEGGMLQCKGHLVPHLEPTSIACCSDGDYCNRKLQPMYVLPPEGESSTAAGGASTESGLAALGVAGFHQTTFIALIASITACFGETWRS